MTPCPPDHRSARPRPRRAAGAFTLIEVLAALVVLGIVLPVALRGVSIASQSASIAKHRAEAAALAETKLNELLVEGAQTTSGATGDFPDFPGYTYTIQSAQRDYETVEIAVVVAWREQGAERSLSVATLVSPNTNPLAGGIGGAIGGSGLGSGGLR